MRVAHGHRDRRVPQDPLQAENVTTGHHVMTGKGVPQNVGHLARRVEAATLVGAPKGRPAGHEQPTVSRHAHLQRQVLNILGSVRISTVDSWFGGSDLTPNPNLPNAVTDNIAQVSGEGEEGDVKKSLYILLTCSPLATLQ